jgi:hypothetical protein
MAARRFFDRFVRRRPGLGRERDEADRDHGD